MKLRRLYFLLILLFILLKVSMADNCQVTKDIFKIQQTCEQVDNQSEQNLKKAIKNYIVPDREVLKSFIHHVFGQIYSVEN